MSIEGAPVPSMTVSAPEPDEGRAIKDESALDLGNLEHTVVSSSLTRVRKLTASHPSRTVEVIRGWLWDGRPTHP